LTIVLFWTLRVLLSFSTMLSSPSKCSCPSSAPTTPFTALAHMIADRYAEIVNSVRWRRLAQKGPGP
jgi:hypothetical protein